MVNPGQYKAKGMKGSVQLGETEAGTLQIAIDMDIKDPQGQSLGQMTTFLYFSPPAAPYSYERLRSLGWKGNGPQDIDTNMDIDTNEVDVRVTQPESYRDPKDGTTKMGVSKIEILTGAGKVTINKPLDKATFAARLAAIGGVGGSTPAASGGGGASKPPF